MKFTNSLLVIAILVGSGFLRAQTVESVVTFATGASVNATQPDPIALASDGSIWISWQNGADSTGLSGSSTVVQYDKQGNVMKMYSITGCVDGLKEDPRTREMWVLQNQDGNSTRTIINLKSGITIANVPYAVLSATEGYDDVVFLQGKVFQSYTNPAAPEDPVISMIKQGTDPIVAVPILLRGATGENLATGQTQQPLPMNDPDSLKQLSGTSGLQLTSGDDGALIFVVNPGAMNQKVAFLNVLDPLGNPTSGLDDSLFVDANAGTFYLSDTGNNRVIAIRVAGITSGQLFASSGSQNALVVVDSHTGISTILLGSLNAPHGFAFWSGN